MADIDSSTEPNPFSPDPPPLAPNPSARPLVLFERRNLPIPSGPDAFLLDPLVALPFPDLSCLAETLSAGSRLAYRRRVVRFTSDLRTGHFDFFLTKEPGPAPQNVSPFLNRNIIR